MNSRAKENTSLSNRRKRARQRLVSRERDKNFIFLLLPLTVWFGYTAPLSKRVGRSFFLPNHGYNFLKAHLHQFSKIMSPKEVTKQEVSRFFLLFLLDDRRLIEGSGSGSTGIRIREAQKHVDPVDPDSDPDPDAKHFKSKEYVT